MTDPPEETRSSDARRRATRERFDQIASIYDAQFVRFVDKYQEMLDVMIAHLRELKPDAESVLDLGLGTGEVSQRVLETLPSARVHGVDFSEKMIEGARTKLQRHAGRFTWELADLSGYRPAPGRTYDAVVSSITIHHLADTEKRALVIGVCGALRKGGIFLNADLARGETELESRTSLALHLESLRGRGLDENAIQERLARHREHDIPARLSDQIAWLQEAGCGEIWVPWRHLTQALLIGAR